MKYFYDFSLLFPLQWHKTRYWNNRKRGTADQLWLKKADKNGQT